MQVPPSTPSLDSVRAVLRRVFSNPKYEWVEVPDPWRVLREMFERFVSWLELFRQEHPVGRIVLLSASILVLVAITVHLGYVVYQVLRSRAEPVSRSTGTPSLPRLDEDAYLDLARRLSAEGRYAEAVGHRFSALLLRLERLRAVRFHPSKTPAEYLREATLADSQRAGLKDLVGALYDYVFGGVPCTRNDWLRFDERAGTLA